MLSIAHAVTGAAIATYVPDPFLSVPLIFASHFLEDMIPHWDAGTGLTSGKLSRRRAFFQELPDLFLAAIFVIILFPPASLTLSSLLSYLATPPVWGAFLALVPDFLEAPRNFLNKEPRWLAPINKFHHSFHHSIPRMVDGLAPQVLLLVLLFLTR